jgi:hypothetical protein
MKRESSTSPKTMLINKTQTSLESHQRRKTSMQAAKMGYKMGKIPTWTRREEKPEASCAQGTSKCIKWVQKTERKT